MGKWVTAQTGDTFCGLAVMGGFLDCQKLRDHNANAAIKSRQLQAGDKVYIPTITEGSDSAATEQTHVFVRNGAPFASIRFVRGDEDAKITTESAISHLQISNFRTDKGGTDGTKTFAVATKWQHDADSFIDPDTFKIEISDRRATDATLQVEFQALHPIYSGTIVTGYDLAWSSTAERDRRKLDVTVHRATPLPDQRYRSPYLRLVTDEADQTARPLQTLLVTDDQPNEEKIEILDQKVRATYIIKTCPIAGDARCRVSAEAPVGARDHAKRRIKLCVGILRQNVGDATGFNGITEAMVRHRLFRWVRRVYAQADFAPVLVGPKIRLLDPPSQNLITVSDINGNPATGTTGAGASPSQMSFTITSNRSDGTTKTKNISINITAPATGTVIKPIDIANRLVTAINDADFTAQTFENSASVGAVASNKSADVLIRDTGNGRVTISSVLSTENAAGATLTAANVNLNGYQDASGGDMENGSLHERQLLRNYDTGTDKLDCYVVGQFQGGANTRGRAYTSTINMPADYRTTPEIVNSCVMGSTSSSGMVMDGGNNLPYTFSHELGHCLLDCFHAKPEADSRERSELMATGTSTASSVGATKRLCDVPVQRKYPNYDPAANYATVGGTLEETYQTATRLGTISPFLFDSW